MFYLDVGTAAVLYLLSCAIGVWVRYLKRKLKRVEWDVIARQGR